MILDKDAFSSGQVGSKIWLCEELEKLFAKIDDIAIFGGWYSISAFLLFSRNNIEIKKIRSYDVDPRCEEIADLVNEYWKWQNWQFKSFTADCNSLILSEKPDLVINTSTEHFESLEWFDRLPAGQMVALQGADMDHNDHIFRFENIDQFIETFKISEVFYSGTKTFEYPNWSFKRFMIIGQK